MNFFDQIQWVFKVLWAYRLRSALTVVGFAVGIASVTLLTALGEGMRQFIMEEFTQFGSRIVAITPGKTETYGLGGLLNTTRPLTLDDAESLQRITTVEFVVPVVFGSGQVKSETRSRYVDIAGVAGRADKAWKINVAQGRFLPTDNWQQPRAFAVLGSQLKQELFGHASALGQTVTIAQSRFVIVGVMESKGEFLGTNLDELIYIPAQKALQLFNRSSLMEIDVFYKPQVSAEQIAATISKRLIDRHGMEDFTLVTQDAMLKSLDNILSIVKWVAAGLSSIALIVGGVGILTVFSISVAERKQEIGLLQALGMNGNQMQRLFLAEAITLALVGALVGYVMVTLPLLLVTFWMPSFPFEAEFLVFVGAMILSAIIGALSGIQPARQAANLAPIEALRDE